MSMNLNPESELIPEEEVRTALRCHQLDAGTFEAGIRARIRVAEAERANDPLADAPQRLRVAAAFLPLPIITAGKVTGNAASLANASGLGKLLAYGALPAISLFVILGAAIFGIARVRSVQRDNVPDKDQAALLEATGHWWRRHRWFAGLFFALTLALAWLGATSLMLLLYLISLGVMLYVLSGFAKRGLGDRGVIGRSCLMGLMFLGQLSAFAGIGDQDIHFVDPLVIAAVFFSGALVLLALVMGSPTPQMAGWRSRRIARWLLGGLFVVLVVAVMAWFMNPLLWPATPERIKSRVESFDHAPNSTASWRAWEIVARWAVESKLDPDLSRPRRLLAAQLAGEQNPFILGSAFRVGLVRADQIGQLRDYDDKRHALLDVPQRVPEPIASLDQQDWVIRATVLRNDLSHEERDYLQKRLHATLDNLSQSPYDVLETALRATQLLQVIERPVTPDRYRARVHDWLRKFHSKTGGGFQVAGGFKQYLSSPPGSVETTAYAVELMEIYGIPDDLDLNWVRSFVRPLVYRFADDKWIAAVTRERLNHLPGLTQPTWLEILYHERSLLMAVLLVALCIYATLSSPLLTCSLARKAPGAPSAGV